MKAPWFKPEVIGSANAGNPLPVVAKRCRILKYLFSAFSFAMAANLFAQNAPALFNEANKLYEQGRYPDAATAYEKIIQTGAQVPAVYFNLGNAFLKAGKTGRAIVAYRTAEKLSPRDPDLRANLQFARDQAAGGVTNAPQHWTNWTTRLTLNEWTLLTSLTLSAWFMALAMRQWNPKWKKSFGRTLLVLGVIAGFFVVCLISAVRAESGQSSVVIVSEAVIRRGPFDESQSVFSLRDGAEVTVLDRNAEWLKIVDGSQRTGWLLQRQLLTVPGAKL